MRELTPKHLEILTLVRDGHTNGEIGKILRISEQTVKNHLSVIYNRLDAVDRTSAVIAAIRLGFLPVGNGAK